MAEQLPSKALRYLQIILRVLGVRRLPSLAMSTVQHLSQSSMLPGSLLSSLHAIFPFPPGCKSSGRALYRVPRAEKICKCSSHHTHDLCFSQNCCTRSRGRRIRAPAPGRILNEHKMTTPLGHGRICCGEVSQCSLIQMALWNSRAQRMS